MMSHDEERSYGNATADCVLDLYPQYTGDIALTARTTPYDAPPAITPTMRV